MLGRTSLVSGNFKQYWSDFSNHYFRNSHYYWNFSRAVIALWEFISPKIKERLQKLEAENDSLKQELEQIKTDTGKRSGVLPLILVVLLLMAVALFQFYKSTQNSSEEIARMKVELWKSGEAIDTSFIPSDDIIFNSDRGV